MTVLELPLRGAGGEQVDVWRTLVSHGLTDLPPMKVDDKARILETTIPLAGTKPRTIRVRQGAPGSARVEVLGPAPSARVADRVRATVRLMLRLGDDLSPFYRAVRDDPDLSWAAGGAGRMAQSPTLFEDVVKTICTTNCNWSATVKMTTALVERLGEPGAGGHGRAFPTPEALARAPDRFYRKVARTGYRGPYIRAIARAVARGTLDLEAWRRATPEELPDVALRAKLLALPGIGPYAAAHVMLLMGRCSLLVLDSWTRPKYARLTGRRASDAAIERRFHRYGRYAGLAFWLFLTRDWVAEAAS